MSQLQTPSSTIVEEMPINIDSTMISCFRSCPKKFYNEFILGLRPYAVSVDLHAGGCFATAMESFNKEFWLNGHDLERARAAAFSAFTHAWGDFEPATDTPKTQDNTWLAFEDYLAKYPPRTDHIQPLFLENIPTFEFTFAIPLDLPGFPLNPATGEPYIYSGRFDLLGTYHSRPIVKDDKTGKTAGPKWSEQWGLRSQFMGYCWACQREGIPVDTVAVRGVIIQKTQFQQLECIKVFPDHLIEKWLNRLRFDLHQLTWSWQNGYWPENLADSCTQYGLCQFADLCLSRSDAEKVYRQNFVVRRWNPLQKDPTSPQPLVIQKG